MLYSSTNKERCVSQRSALALAQQEIALLELSCDIQCIGEEIRTCRCILYDQHGLEISLGNGKGIGEQSEVSAIYEALEHLFTDVAYLRDTIFFTRVAALSSSLKSDKACELLQHHYPDAIIPCRSYNQFNGDTKIQYPIFLAHPEYTEHCLNEDTFDYTRLIRYTTNSGTAIGTSFEEAAIHSISEIVERDAYSLFLLQTFIRPQPFPVRIIQKHTLPEHLSALVIEVEDITKHGTLLLDITTDLGIPTICTVLLDTPHPIPYLGFGSSLSREYACERSVLEALQAWHLYGTYQEDREEDIRFDTEAIERFSHLPRYQNCIKFDLATLLLDSSIALLSSFDTLPIHATPNELSTYLDLLCNLIEQKHFTIFYAKNYISSSGITCLHCIIPGLERFHLVRGGNPVVPGERGKRILF